MSVVEMLSEFAAFALTLEVRGELRLRSVFGREVARGATTEELYADWRRRAPVSAWGWAMYEALGDDGFVPEGRRREPSRRDGVVMISMPQSPEGLPLLVRAAQALNVLLSEALEAGQDAVGALSLVRLREALERGVLHPRDAEGLVGQVLVTRREHASAVRSEWRDVVRFTLAHALTVGLPGAQLARLLHADQVQGDLAGQPRLFGERLVALEAGTLVVHVDVPVVFHRPGLN